MDKEKRFNEQGNTENLSRLWRYVCHFFTSDFVKIERDEITGQKPKNISNLEPNKDWDQTNR